MRRGVVFAGLLLLAACSGGSERDTLLSPRLPPGLAERFYPPEGWAWGEIRLGNNPPQRYGVSAPAGAPRGIVLILPDYGESAETWFETVHDLNEAGWTVWVLDGAGQGGSGRRAGPRDLGHVESFEPDIAAVRAMVRAVIKPPSTTPVVILGQGVGGLIAIRAAERGLASDGLILSSPTLTPSPASDSPLLRVFGLGATRLPGAAGWRGDGPARSADPWRGRVTAAWQGANPPLRMGGPSRDWVAAYDGAVAAARQRLGRIDTPVLLLEGERPRGCQALPACSAVAFAKAGRSLEIEPDAIRARWLDAIRDFLRGRIAAKASLPKDGAPL